MAVKLLLGHQRLFRRYKHEKAIHLGRKLSRLRFARLVSAMHSHFVCPFGLANRRSFTAHPFLFYNPPPFIIYSNNHLYKELFHLSALCQVYFPQSKPPPTKHQTVTKLSKKSSSEDSERISCSRFVLLLFRGGTCRQKTSLHRLKSHQKEGDNKIQRQWQQTLQPTA